MVQAYELAAKVTSQDELSSIARGFVGLDGSIAGALRTSTVGRTRCLSM